MSRPHRVLVDARQWASIAGNVVAATGGSALGVLPPIFFDHGRHFVLGVKLFPFHGPKGYVIGWQDAPLGAFHPCFEIVMLLVEFLEMLVVMKKCVNNRLVVLKH